MPMPNNKNDGQKPSFFYFPSIFKTFFKYPNKYPKSKSYKYIGNFAGIEQQNLS